MFKTTSCMAAMAISTAEAVKMTYRPYAGTVPWGSAATLPEWVDPQDHPVNYFVPNFGVDSDIKATFKHTADTEEKLDHVLQASFDPPKEPPRNYFVPHFGEDTDIKSSKKNLYDAEHKFNHELNTDTPDPPKRDYFVPHFGEDTDIKATKEVIALSEKKLGHELDTSPPPDDPPRNYFVPHFGEDEDITFTKKNIANAEKAVGTWNVKRDGNGAWVLPGVDANQYKNYKAENTWPSDMMPSLVQVDSNVNADVESDPICSSAGCTQYKHKKKALGYKINYSVPNFGRDHDINDNFASLSLAEGMIGHTFQIGTAASKEKWHNPAKDVDYNFNPALDGDVISTMKNLDDTQKNLGHKWVIDDVQLDSDVHLDSDPICSSAGCTQYKHKKKPLGYKINYPVPNFGVDTDIIDNHASLELAESMKSHKLALGTEASKAKWHNPAKDVDYNFAPKLDGDIITTNKNLADTQKNLGHVWELA